MRLQTQFIWAWAIAQAFSLSLKEEVMQIFGTNPKWFREDFDPKDLEVDIEPEVQHPQPEPLISSLEEELKRKKLSKLIMKTKLVNG
ncbi:hypothetical protein [Rivularia sp. PCC 7116]|uniref:hypothetical protein n=1 Tax=Rivularia sp. PCC 7116 TaxID=373994 RepID=UPI0005C7AB2C|nr:hypothetical protein [Rivularia sp. PCC 7116]